MKSSKIVCLLLLPLAGLFADIKKDSGVIKEASGFLTPKLLMKMFKGENLDQAYALAQEEDFEPGEPELFTPSMQKFLSAPVKEWYENLEKLDGFQKLQFIHKRNDDEKIQLLQVWRYEFLMKMMDAMRYRNSLKPTLKFLVSSVTQYDSNVNKYPECQPWLTWTIKWQRRLPTTLCTSC